MGAGDAQSLDAARHAAERLGIEFLIVEIYTPKHLRDEWKPTTDVAHMGAATHIDAMEQCYAL